MELTVASRTDVGRIRTNNEDNFFIDQTSGLFIVCDGMGGHNAGEVASKLACEIIAREIDSVEKLRQRYVEQGNPADLVGLGRALENAVLTACKEIFRQASRNDEQHGMGTTCVAMWLVGRNKAIYGHVGDSRLYLQRQEVLHQLTDDHTYVNELVKRGALAKEQSKNHPQGNVLSRALGVSATIRIDTMVFDLDPGDTVLICSDGLYNYFPNDDELANRLTLPHLETCLKTLFEKALERGGHDNITAIALRVEPAQTVPAVATAHGRIEVMLTAQPFRHLTYLEAIRLLGLSRAVRCAPDTLIIVEGQPSEEFFVVLEGEIDVVKDGAVVATLGAGEPVGDMAMFDKQPRAAAARSSTESTLLLFRREEFYSILRSEPLLGVKLLAGFAERLQSRFSEEALAQGGPRLPFEMFVDEGV